MKSISEFNKIADFCTINKLPELLEFMDSFQKVPRSEQALEFIVNNFNLIDMSNREQIRTSKLWYLMLIDSFHIFAPQKFYTANMSEFPMTYLSNRHNSEKARTDLKIKILAQLNEYMLQEHPERFI